MLENHRIAGSMMRPGAAGVADSNEQEKQEVDFLKRYIHYCRSQCAPRLSESAQERLAAYYVEIRDEVSESRQRWVRSSRSRMWTH